MSAPHKLRIPELKEHYVDMIHVHGMQPRSCNVMNFKQTHKIAKWISATNMGKSRIHENMASLEKKIKSCHKTTWPK